MANLVAVVTIIGNGNPSKHMLPSRISAIISFYTGYIIFSIRRKFSESYELHVKLQLLNSSVQLTDISCPTIF